MNAALQTVCTAKIKPTNQLIYTTARVVVDMVGYRMNSHKEQDPPWRRRLEAKSKTAWGEVSQQSEMQKGVMNGCPINPLSFLPFSVRTVSFLCLCAISLRSLAHVFTPTATLWLRWKPGGLKLNLNPGCQTRVPQSWVQVQKGQSAGVTSKGLLKSLSATSERWQKKIVICYYSVKLWQTSRFI